MAESPTISSESNRSPNPPNGGANGNNGKPRERRTGRFLILALLILAMAAFGVRTYIHFQLHETTDDATIEGHVIPISPRVAGHVARVLVDDNQLVKKGDLLVEIDPHDFKAEVAQKQANLESAIAKEKGGTIAVTLITVTAGANLTQASSGVNQAESTMHASRASVEAARAQAVKTAADLRRLQSLFQAKVVSQEELDAGIAAARAAAENLRAAQSQAEATQAQISEAKGKLTSARSVLEQVAASKAQAEALAAGVNQARAELQTAQLQLSYTKIVAPETGRITKKNVEPGSYVQVGQILFAIVSPRVWVVANFKETQLTRMRVGQPVDIYVDTYPGDVFKGHVDSIQAGTGARFSLLPPENATGNFVKVVQRVPVKIVFDAVPDSKYILAPGMSVEPEVHVSGPEARNQ